MTKKAHRDSPAPKPADVVRSLMEIVDITNALAGPYMNLYREAYDSGGGTSEVRISGGGEADPVADLLDSRDHARLHSSANSIAKNIEEARRELGNAKAEMERAVGRSFRQPPHDRKGVVSADDLEQAVGRRQARMAAGGEMERVQREGS